MALDRALHCISVPADADLSSEQFRAVAVNSDGEAVKATGAGTAFLGILRNKPAAAGVPAEIAIGGVSRAEAGTPVNEGDALIADSDGKVVPAGTADIHIVGMALTAASADGDFIEVMVNPAVRTEV